MTENKILGARVLVKPIQETTTTGGIIISDSSKDKPKSGEIVLVGPGTKDIQMCVEPGNVVLFSEYSGVEVELEGTKYLIMSQDDIFMIIKKK